MTALAGVLMVVQVFAWDEPTQAPPGGNAPAPLNVSSIGQTKAGGLLLNTAGADNGLLVDKGNVGIGTLNPLQKLHVVGGKAQADDFCLNSDPAKCLSGSGGGGGGGVGQKMCIASHSGDNWFVTMQVPSSWTIADCKKTVNMSAHPFNAANRYQVGCVFANSVSVGPIVSQSGNAAAPSPNCGW